MSDEKLRALERRWRASGSVQDEAAWLAERVRSGSLPAVRLQLAAHCRDPVALLLLPGFRPGWASRLSTAIFGEWLLPGLRPFGKEVVVRALILAARVVVRDCGSHLLPDPRPVEAVEAAERWAAEPTEANRTRAAVAAQAALGSSSWFSGAGGQPPPGMAGAPPALLGTEQLAAIYACAAPARMVNDDLELNLEGAPPVALRFFSGGTYAGRLAEVQAAVRTGLADWALARSPR